MIDLNEVYKSVLEADKAAVVICDLDHKIIYMNPASICRYEKWGGKDLMGKSLLDCHNEKSREMIIKVLEWFKASKDNNIVYTSHNSTMGKIMVQKIENQHSLGVCIFGTRESPENTFCTMSSSG